MDVHAYKQRLLELEHDLSARAARTADLGREQRTDTAVDAGDRSVTDESESEDFSEAERDAVVLDQVRDALRRIGDGTYGHCAVDGQPIDEARLDAVPWAKYCSRHQREIEGAPQKGPTL